MFCHFHFACHSKIPPPRIHTSGLSVFLQYQEGSSRLGKGSAKYRVPGMQWLGLRPSQLDDLDLPEKASGICSHEQLLRECCQRAVHPTLPPPSI